MGLFDIFKPKEVIKSAQPLQRLNANPISTRFIDVFYDLNNKAHSKKFNNDSLLRLYEEVTQVNSIINYTITKGGDVIYKHVKYLAGGEIKDLGETELLKSLQSNSTLVRDAMAQLLIQGNCFILKKYTPGFKYPKFIVLDSCRAYAIPQYSIDQYGTPSLSYPNYENPIIKYRYELESGVLIDIPLEEIIHIRDINPRNTGINYYNGASRLYAATRSINVLSNIYDTINTILSAKGALGFLSRDTKAGEVDPMQWEQVVKEIETKINNDYGTTGGRNAIMATFANMRWNRMDSPISEFMPIELNAQEFSQLCNQLGGFPDVLLNSKGNSTYNNVLEMYKGFMVNLLMPLHKNIFDTISTNLGITKQNEWIMADYSAEESLNTNTLDKIKYMFDSNLISKNQTLSLLGQPENDDPTFNIIENGSEPNPA